MHTFWSFLFSFFEIFALFELFSVSKEHRQQALWASDGKQAHHVVFCCAEANDQTVGAKFPQPKLVLTNQSQTSLKRLQHNSYVWTLFAPHPPTPHPAKKKGKRKKNKKRLLRWKSMKVYLDNNDTVPVKFEFELLTISWEDVALVQAHYVIINLCHMRIK